MAVRKIFQEGSDILLKHCREVTAFDDKLGTLVDDMFETMEKADGAGLAAPQVGFLKRIAVVENEGMKLELVNPKIIAKEGEQLGEEGCLSVDFSKNCKVMRPYKVTVRACDRKGKAYERTVEGLTARAVCHELDHLDGILFYTRRYEGNE
jgi:peptide deformylase